MKLVPGSEGIEVWTLSRDGRWIFFVAPVSGDSQQRRIMKAAVDGSSPPVALADWEQAWETLVTLESGDILIGGSSPDGAVYRRFPATGGSASAPARIDLGTVRGYVGLAVALPRDRGVIAQVASWGPRGYAHDIWVIDLKTNKAHRLVEDASNRAYLSTGHLAFSRGDTLMAAPFDAERLALTGELTAVLRGLRVGGAWGHGSFSVSDNGVLTYVAGGRLGLARRLVIVDDLRKLRIGNTAWDILADGRLFGIQKDEGEGPDAPRTFAIVLNWHDELKRRMPQP